MSRKKREAHEEFLKGIEIFAKMDPNELVKVIDVSRIVDLPAGEEIIAQVVNIINYREMKDIPSIY